jgi:glycosyltransferase involved in cell wall biosynthesis
MGTVKVSVVMASYNTGPRIEWTISELQRQSLDPSEFEIVVIDDGSSDDTYVRLQHLAGAYSNLVVDRIPNSGWPGRPRNVGVRKAVGEYVFFMDHDDAMFPEALDRLHTFARQADADVVIPKEVVDGWKTPGWPTWHENVDRVEALDAATVACITPHKLYRRAFLLEHDVQFPEGRIRLEDFDYNAQVWVRTDKIAIYSEYPCYTWIIGEGNSHKAGYDVQVYWDSFERSLQPIVKELPPGPKQDTLLVRWYRSRILERLNPQMLKYTDSWRGTLSHHFERLLPYFPPSLDASLTPADRARSALLRRGDWDALGRLAELDRGLRTKVTHTEATWDSTGWVITCRGHVEGASGSLEVTRVDGRLRRVLPSDLRLTPEATDLTDAVATSRVDLIVRNRKDNVDWDLPTTAEFTIAGDKQEGALAFTVRAELDPATAAFGEALDAGVWDVILRITGLGWTPAARLAAPRQISGCAISHGRQALLYTTLNHTLALDTMSEARTLLDHAKPARAELVAAAHADEVSIRWPLPNIRVPEGEHATLQGTVAVDDRWFPARVIANSSGATLLAFVQLPEDSENHALRAQFGTRASRPLAGLRRGSGGVKAVQPPSPPSEPEPVVAAPEVDLRDEPPVPAEDRRSPVVRTVLTAGRELRSRWERRS